ncbi:MAG: YegP family protein [Aeromicrobium sp.]
MQFVIDEAEDGFFWLLKGANGKVICVSEHVDSRQACLDMITATRDGAPDAVTVDNTLQH